MRQTREARRGGQENVSKLTFSSPLMLHLSRLVDLVVSFETICLGGLSKGNTDTQDKPTTRGRGECLLVTREPRRPGRVLTFR